MSPNTTPNAATIRASRTTAWPVGLWPFGLRSVVVTAGSSATGPPRWRTWSARSPDPTGAASRSPIAGDPRPDLRDFRHAQARREHPDQLGRPGVRVPVDLRGRVRDGLRDAGQRTAGHLVRRQFDGALDGAAGHVARQGG